MSTQIQTTPEAILTRISRLKSLPACRPGEATRVRAPREMVEATRSTCMQALTAGTRGEMAEALAPLVRFIRAFGLGSEAERVAAEVWMEALDDLPAWAVAGAVKQVKRTWKWRNAPLPADIREALPAEYWRVCEMRDRCSMALDHGDFGPEVEEERAPPDELKRLVARAMGRMTL